MKTLPDHRSSTAGSQTRSATKVTEPDQTTPVEKSFSPISQGQPNRSIPDLEIEPTQSPSADSMKDNPFQMPDKKSGKIPQDEVLEELEGADAFPGIDDAQCGQNQSRSSKIPTEIQSRTSLEPQTQDQGSNSKASLTHSHATYGRDRAVPFPASMAYVEESTDSDFDLGKTLYRQSETETGSYNGGLPSGVSDKPSNRAQRKSNKDSTKSSAKVEMPKGSQHFGAMVPQPTREPKNGKLVLSDHLQAVSDSARSKSTNSESPDQDILSNSKQPTISGSPNENSLHPDDQGVRNESQASSQKFSQPSGPGSHDMNPSKNKEVKTLQSLHPDDQEELSPGNDGSQKHLGSTQGKSEQDTKEVDLEFSAPGDVDRSMNSPTKRSQTYSTKITDTNTANKSKTTTKNGLSDLDPEEMNQQPQEPVKVSVVDQINTQFEGSVSETPRTPTRRTSHSQHEKAPPSENVKPPGPSIDDLVDQWLQETPNADSLKQPDDRIMRLQDIATRINKKYARGEFQCRVDFHADRTGRNSVKRPSTYPYELEESGRKVITSTSIFESLELVFQEAIEYVIDNHIDFTNTNFSRNLMEDMENLHYFEADVKKMRNNSGRKSRRGSFQHGSLVSERFGSSFFAESTVRQLQSRLSKSSIDVSNALEEDTNSAGFCSNTKIMPNQASQKEKDRLKAIFNFVRIQIKHSRMLDTAYFLCLCSKEEFNVKKLWGKYLGNIALQSNFYRTWALILLERLTEFSFSCESVPLEVGDLLVTLTKSEMYKKIIIDSFAKCVSTPAESMENFLDTMFPSPGNPPVREILDKNKLKACATYELFLVQYLCHCVYLQRLAVLSLPYQILDLLTFSLRTSDRELVNLQEALNESLICLAVANFAHSTQYSRNSFEELFKSPRDNPVRETAVVKIESDQKGEINAKFHLKTLGMTCY